MNYLRFFCRDLSLLSHLFIQSFIYVNRTNGCLLYLLGYNSMLLYFFAPTLSALAIVSSVGSCTPSAFPHMWFFLLFSLFPFSEYFQDVPGSSYMFSATVLGSAISPRSLAPFRNQDPGAGCAHCYQGILWNFNALWKIVVKGYLMSAKD